MTESTYNFPPGFAFGAATAAYQIEGAWDQDGKGESIWDRFCHTPGNILDGTSGDIACDHYQQYKDDVLLMRDIGLRHYRFSLSWPRIFPNGRGQINSKGMDFYERLIERLLQAGIDPFVTAYHWDLPQALQEKGGWANRDTCHYFQDYCAAAMERLGDRVKFWSTINEPWVIANLGHLTGQMAPGIRNEKIALQVSHNLLLAHGLAVQAMRAVSPQAQVGIVTFLAPTDPASDKNDDIQAAEFSWQQDSAWYLDPLLKGAYPEDVWSFYGNKVPKQESDDMKLISQKLDYIGINFYFRNVISRKGKITHIPGSEYTAMGWEVYPQALKELLLRITKDYDLPPIYITENGAAFEDIVTVDERIHDIKRINYLRNHLLAVLAAIKEGVDIRGYFCWSLMDNFEWAYGLSKRFGLIHIDYENGRRLLKDSAHYYSRVIHEHSVSPE